MGVNEIQRNIMCVLRYCINIHGVYQLTEVLILSFKKTEREDSFALIKTPFKLN